MAIISPPAYQQGGTYSARTDRLSVITGLLGYHGSSADEASLRTRGGVRPSYQGREMQVTAQSTPNMTVSVSAGISYVQNKDLANYGAYVAVNDGAVTLPIAASSGSQYRKDTICVQVLDAETLGTVNAGALVVVQGPYAASAGATTRGVLPPNSTVLADIAVDAGVTSITNAKITDARVFQVAAGGILPVVSTAVPDHPAPGQVMYLTDTSVLRYGRQDGTTRQVITDEQITAGAWTTFVPAWTASTTNPTLGNGTLTSRWCRVGRMITWVGSLQLGSTSNGGTGLWSMSLPVQAAGSGILQTGTCDYVNAGDNEYVGLTQITSGATTCGFLVKTGTNSQSSSGVSNSSPVGASQNTRVHWSITYEAAV
ncbi:hypothetical protein ACWD4P_12605 [Kitasatospora sp. NPDC002543]